MSQKLSVAVKKLLVPRFATNPMRSRVSDLPMSLQASGFVFEHGEGDV